MVLLKLEKILHEGKKVEIIEKLENYVKLFSSEKKKYRSFYFVRKIFDVIMNEKTMLSWAAYMICNGVTHVFNNNSSLFHQNLDTNYNSQCKNSYKNLL